MISRRFGQATEKQKKRSLLKRMVILHSFWLVCLLIVIARLIELQVIDKNDYRVMAQSQHFNGVRLPAQRGEILALNSKTGETAILATNTTLDLVYVDPLIVDDPALIAEKLSDILLTEEFHELCRSGVSACPRELTQFYSAAFDPLSFAKRLGATGALLEPIPAQLPTGVAADAKLPDLTEARRLFARDIERRISVDRVTFVPLKYSATKVQMNNVSEMRIPGVAINWEQELVYANPEEVTQSSIPAVSRQLAPLFDVEPIVIQNALRSRPLRYVPVMRKLPPKLTLTLKELQLQSLKATNERRANATREEREKIQDPLRAIALLPEHWRFYPDETIGSQVIGFQNSTQESQYGVERTYDTQLRGQEGLISTVSDLHGGQILTSDQRIVDPKDGDTVVLTIDPFIQKKVEEILERTVKQYDAEGGQAIVMEPYTGRILAMVNAPLFPRNTYADVFEKEPYVPPALIALENCVLLPHLGSATVETRQAMAQLALDNIIAWSQGQALLTGVQGGSAPVPAGLPRDI